MTINRSAVVFNSPIEIGLRALAILVGAFPQAYSLQKLIILDYIIVHSDDIPGGPKGLHPKTPHRSGELLVRRDILQKGLLLYQSRNLVECHYTIEGLMYSATENSAAFLDSLCSSYASDLKIRASWIIDSFGNKNDNVLEQMIRNNIGLWGAEFEMESVLWLEDTL